MDSFLPTAPFYFLRHGVTDYNQRRLVMGQMDIPVNDMGRRQARQAAALLTGLGISRVVSSPLVRARETARIIASALGLRVSVADGFRERDWGAMSGRSYREMMEAKTVPEGAETTEQFSSRVIAALRALPNGPLPLFVAHSGTCRVLRRHLSIDDDHRPVPNALPILFFPDGSGRWRERVIASMADREAVGTRRTDDGLPLNGPESPEPRPSPPEPPPGERAPS